MNTITLSPSGGIGACEAGRPRHNWVAFTGYSRTGKDTAALPLIARGFTRRCFGDIIKRRIENQVEDICGFSSFTQVDAEKAIIRPILEWHGDYRYQDVMNEFFIDLARIRGPVVNSRLCRGAEAREWTQRGGIIIRLKKAPYTPHTQWEVTTDMEVSPFVTHELENNSSIEDLHSAVMNITYGQVSHPKVAV